MDGPFPKWKFELEVANCTPVAGFSLKQKTAFSCKCFAYMCVPDSLLLLAAFLCGGGQGLQGDKFSQGGKRRSWDEIKGRRDPLVGGYGL